jgi:protein-tyrosine phosphatase
VCSPDALGFSWITELLAVGGCYPAEQAERLASDHGLRAVVDLRDEDRDDHAELTRHGIELLHLPTQDRCAVSPEMLERGVAFVRAHLARGERVLVHCQHGIGRSATLALCVLVEDGLAPLAALELAKTRRGLVSPSPEQFGCWAAWLRAGGHPVPSFEEFATIAYRHLREAR